MWVLLGCLGFSAAPLAPQPHLYVCRLPLFSLLLFTKPSPTGLDCTIRGWVDRSDDGFYWMKIQQNEQEKVTGVLKIPLAIRDGYGSQAASNRLHFHR